MSREALQQKNALAFDVYYPEYQRIVELSLAQAYSLAELFQAFNRAFPGHTLTSRRCQPREIEAGRVTCDTAGLLVAIWYQLIHQIDQVVVAVFDCDRGVEPHRCLGLPTKDAISKLGDSDFVDRTYQDQVRLRPTGSEEITWVHWKIALGLNYLKHETRTELDTPFSWLMRKQVVTPSAFAKLIIGQSKPESTEVLLARKRAHGEVTSLNGVIV